MLILDDAAIEQLQKLEADRNGNKKSVTLEIIEAISFYNDSEGRFLPGLSEKKQSLVESMVSGLCERSVIQEIGHEKTSDKGPVSMQERSVLKQNFNAIWTIYPAYNRKDKELAYAMYLRYCRFYEIDELMRTLRRWINSGDWAEEDGKYIPDITKYLSQKRYWCGAPRQEKPAEIKKKPDVVSSAELACIVGEERRAVVKFALRILGTPNNSLVECKELHDTICLQMNVPREKVEAALTEAFKLEIIDKFRNKEETFYSLRNNQWDNMTRIEPPKRPYPCER